MAPAEGQPTPATTATRAFKGRFLFPYKIDASFISPDRVAAQITASAGEPFNITVIGDKHWITQEGQWQEAGAQYAVPYQPLEICNAILPELDLNQAEGKKETVNDVSALHYAFASTPSGQAMATIFGAESDMAVLFQTMDVDVWVAEKGGWPVKIDVRTSGLYGDWRQLKGTILIELRDINADDIKVEPPI